MKIKSFIKGMAFYLANNFIAKFPSFRVRHWYYKHILRYQIGMNSSIHMGVFVTGPNIKIGDNSVVNRRIHLDGRIGIIIKDNVSISPEVYIISMEHDYSDPVFKTMGNEVIIENNAWVGVRAIILPGVTIGEGAVVGAGSIVTRSVEPYQIVAGVPARKIGERPREIKYRHEYFPWFDSDIQRG